MHYWGGGPPPPLATLMGGACAPTKIKTRNSGKTRAEFWPKKSRKFTFKKGGILAISLEKKGKSIVFLNQ